MVFRRLFVFSFYSLYVLMQAFSLMASSEFQETPLKGTRAPHSSMMPGQVDLSPPQELNRVALIKKTALLEDQQFVLDELAKTTEALKNTSLKTTTTVSSKEKDETRRPAKLKIRKDKDLAKAVEEKKPAKTKKVKKSKAIKNNTNVQEEAINNTNVNNNEREDESRPVTKIIKPDEKDESRPVTKIIKPDEKDESQPVTMIIKPEEKDESRPVTMIIKSYDEEEPTMLESEVKTEKPLKIRNLTSPGTPSIFDDLLGTKKKTFALPTHLEAWELVLLLLAGDDERTGMTYKVYFPDRELSCNYKSLLKGKKEDDLVPFLQLKKFRNSLSLAILKKYLVIEPTNNVVRTLFSYSESRTIESAIAGLKKEIEGLHLNDASARLNTDERRSQSTLAGHISKLAEYQIMEKDYSVEGIILSLTFYQQEKK